MEWLRPGLKEEPAPSLVQRQLLSSPGLSAVTSDYNGMARNKDEKRKGLEAATARKPPFPAQFLDLSSGNNFPLVAWGCFQGAGGPGAQTQVKKGQEND